MTYLNLPAVDHSYRLKGVEPRLIAGLYIAATRFQKYHHFNRRIRVTCGLRSRIEQEKLYNAGKSWTLNSKHLTGAAVDLAILDFNDAPRGPQWVADWDFEGYRKFHEFYSDAADELGFILDWGGHWKQKDGVHWEITNTSLFI